MNASDRLSSMTNRKGELQRLADARGIEVEQLVADAIAKNGNVLRAAMALQVAPNTLRSWLKHNRKKVQTKVTVTAKLVPIDHPADDNVTMPLDSTPEAAY